MTLIVNFTAWLVLLLAAFLPAAAGADSAPSDTAARAIHMLDYVAVDYPAAVEDGRVTSELEYDEQVAFLAQVAASLSALGIADGDPMLGVLGELRAAVGAKVSADKVARYASDLSGLLRERFAVVEMPATMPSLARGKQLFATACVACHGTEGRGDGRVAATLDPRPANLTDPARMLALRPATIYSTITYGVQGTGMPSFDEAYDAQTRYDLAFYAGSLAFLPDDIERGRELAERSPEVIAAHVAGLADLVATPAAALAADSDGRAVIAYLRAHPEALSSRGISLGLVRRRLAESWEAYTRGAPQQAAELGVSAYLDGFEQVEPALRAIDDELRLEVEADFLRYREAIRAGRPTPDVERLYAVLGRRLDAAETRLEDGLGRGATFAASLTIMAREGFEAVLLVMALVGVLVRSGRRDALPYVHAGWIGALVAGAATWLAARHLVSISGAERELIEGVTSLVATAILFYVSYWLISKASSARWQSFLQRQIRTALSGGARSTLVAIAFIAIYREVFETILFYEALWAQSASTGGQPVLLGAATGFVLMAALSVAIFRFGLRLPLQRFFLTSSILLYTLAVVLAGKGVAALQEGAYLPITTLSLPRVEWLGFHPTVQGVTLQALLVGAAVVAALWLRAVRRRERAVSTSSGPVRRQIST